MSYLFLVVVLSLPGPDGGRPPRQPKTQAAAALTAEGQGALPSAALNMFGD
jgi:hypothetical protein